MQAGIEYEGEDEPHADDDERLAFNVARLLANGMGGIDWSGLPLIAGLLGVADVEGLVMRIGIIKTYRKPEEK